MSETYRVTYSAVGATRVALEDRNSRTIRKGVNHAVQAKTEIRSSSGDIYRLAVGSSIQIVDTQEGEQPLLAGQNFHILSGRAWPKYTTSCHSCLLHSSAVLMFLVKQDLAAKQDEYHILSGDMVIHDFDEKGAHFVIASPPEMSKVVISYDVAIPMGPQRYRAAISNLTDAEIDYMMKEFLDPRGWR